MAHKSFYNRWYPGDIFPKSFIHNIEGALLNNHYKSLIKSELPAILADIEYPVVIKPNTDSMGGANVFFAKNKEELISLMKGKNNYVVQEKIEQDEFLKTPASPE